MKIIGESEMVARLDFIRPLVEPKPEPPSAWPIPFEYGAHEKGTRISVAMAQRIIAELRAEVAEHEKRELRRAFDEEKERGKALEKQYGELADRWIAASAENAALKRRLRRRGAR